MPRARLWAESDWSFAIDTLEVAAMFYESLGTGWPPNYVGGSASSGSPPTPAAI